MSDDSATAKVRVTLEVEFGPLQPWGDDTTVAQMKKQAHSDADEMVRKMVQRLTGPDGGEPRFPHRVRVVGTSKTVEVILHKPKKETE